MTDSFVMGTARVVALAYVHLWIVEGALRKWVPSLGQVLYVARDGLIVIAIVMLIMVPFARRQQLKSFWLFALVIVVVALLHVIAGNVSLPVAASGIRAYIAPLLLPLLYLTYRPPGLWIRIVGVVLIYVPIQMAVALAQVVSAPSAWINREVSGDEANFVQDGIVRASGTFSSPSGLTAFTILAFALALGLTLQADKLRTLAAWMLVPAAVLTLSSGSRGTVFGILIVLAVALAISFVRRPGDMLRLIAGLVTAVLLGYWLVSALWPTVLAALFSRFEDASRVEDTGGRLLGQAFGFLMGDVPLAGIGPGAASLAGIALGSGATWVEMDTARWVTELGVGGVLLGILRLAAAGYLVLMLASGARTMPWPLVCLIAVVVPVLATGSITQNPSSQAAFGVALTLLIGAKLADIAQRDHGSERPRFRTRPSSTERHRGVQS
jgi:hypothetical protein